MLLHLFSFNRLYSDITLIKEISLQYIKMTHISLDIKKDIDFPFRHGVQFIQGLLMKD